MGNTDIEDLKTKNAIDKLYFLKDTDWVFKNYEQIVNDSLLEIHTNIVNNKYNTQELEKILGILGIFKKKGLNVADPKLFGHDFMNVQDIEPINILDFDSNLWDDAALKTEVNNIIKSQNFGIHNNKILISSIIGRRINDILAILPGLITLYKNKKAAAGPSANEAALESEEEEGPSASEAQPSASEAQPSASEETSEAVLASEAEPNANEETISNANEEVEEILPKGKEPSFAQQQSGLWKLVDNRWRKSGTFIQLDPNAGPISSQEAGKRKRKTRKYKKRKTLRKRKSLRKRKTQRRKNKRKTLRRN